MSQQRPVALLTLLFAISVLAPAVAGQEGAEQEFDPYVFKNVVLPFKTRNYARDWFGADIAFIQSPLAAPAKQLRESVPVKLPTIKPLIVSWKNLGDTRVNQENTWNFEKRVDSKVWWPNK